jgi:Ca2+-binding EF-hand superfamily protein
MKKTYSILQNALGILALAMTFTVVSSFADEAAPRKEKGPTKAELKKYDANGDGQLDETELARMKADEKARRDAQRAEDLAKYDANKDGKLNKEEKQNIKADREAARAEKKAEKEARKEAAEAK